MSFSRVLHMDSLLGLSGCRSGLDTGSELLFSLSSLVNVSCCLALCRAPGVPQRRSSIPKGGPIVSKPRRPTNLAVLLDARWTAW
jgi:hypothetical protein